MVLSSTNMWLGPCVIWVCSKIVYLFVLLCVFDFFVCGSHHSTILRFAVFFIMESSSNTGNIYNKVMIKMLTIYQVNFWHICLSSCDNQSCLLANYCVRNWHKNSVEIVFKNWQQISYFPWFIKLECFFWFFMGKLTETSWGWVWASLV